MADIGNTLRETRMRQRIDIIEVEAATKIRAKYLRALENEEWDQLPGPTFVRTFLRTYGDYLGLDSRMLVEEYKQRFERPGPQDLLPFAPRAGRRQRRSPVPPPWFVLAVVVVALLAALFALGKWGSGGSETEARTSPTATATATATPVKTSSKHRKRRQAATPRRVRLRIQPTGLVNVCLVSGVSGRVLIRSQNLSAGKTTRTFRAKRFKVTFGNGQAIMRVGKRSFNVPD